MIDDKKREIAKTVMLLNNLFKGLAKDPNTISVEAAEDREVIIVHISGGVYHINVECENERCMIKEVVNAVILKI